MILEFMLKMIRLVMNKGRGYNEDIDIVDVYRKNSKRFHKQLEEDRILKIIDVKIR